MVRAEDMLHSLHSPIKRNIARDPYDNVNDNDDDVMACKIGRGAPKEAVVIRSVAHFKDH